MEQEPRAARRSRTFFIAALAVRLSLLSAANAAAQTDAPSPTLGPQDSGVLAAAPAANLGLDIRPLALGALAPAGAPLPAAAPAILPAPAAAPNASAKPAASPSKALRAAGAGLAADQGGGRETLDGLFSGEPVSTEEDVPGAPSVPGWNKNVFIESLKAPRRDRPQDALLPHLDALWEKGIIGEGELKSWDADLSRRALKSTRREDVFKILAPKVDSWYWPLDKSWWTPQFLSWAWERGGLSEMPRSQLAGNPAAPAAVLRALARDDSPNVRRSAADNPSTPPDVLRALAGDGNFDVRHHVAGNPSAPADALRALARKDVWVLDYLSRNPSMPQDLLAEYARSVETVRRLCAATNPAAPAGVLEALARDMENAVREAVARNPSTPAGALRTLARENDPLIRYGVAGNPSTPVPILRALDALGTEEIKVSLARNPSTPPKILSALARDAELVVRAAVARNRAAPPGALKRLLKDSEAIVRDAAAKNPSAPKKNVARLGDDGLRRLAKKAAAAEKADQSRVLKGVGLRTGKASIRIGLDDAPQSLFARGAFASLWNRRESSPLSAFHNIVIDVRGSRGGHGDVAAGWLTATDMVGRLSRGRAPPGSDSPKITFIFDAKSRVILSRLLGREIVDGGEALDGNVRFHSLDSLPPSFPAADLYLALANPSGALRKPEDFVLQDSDDAGEGGKGIPIGKRTVLIAQTVLGNTENQDSTNPNGLLHVGGRSLSLLPAGLSNGESGVYSDPVAWELRGRSERGVRDYLLEELENVADPEDAEMLRRLVAGETFPDAVPGLVYGISADSVKPQFESYLRGLADSSRLTGADYVLVTPSKFDAADIRDEALRRRVRVLTAQSEAVQAPAEPGTIYILKTKTLPHPVFVGLMAYSRIPPIVSGDGAMSAAIALGRPFVLTRVPWNERNVANLKEKLLSTASGPEERKVLEAVYGELDLSRALELAPYGGDFEGLAASVPSLADSLLAAARAALLLDDASVPAGALLPAIADPALRLDLLVHRAFMGESAARRMLQREIRRGERERASVVSSAERLVSRSVPPPLKGRADISGGAR